MFDFVFTVWGTHLVRAELKVYSAPYGTSAAGPSEHCSLHVICATTHGHKNTHISADVHTIPCLCNHYIYMTALLLSHDDFIFKLCLCLSHIIQFKKN